MLNRKDYAELMEWAENSKNRHPSSISLRHCIDALIDEIPIPAGTVIPLTRSEFESGIAKVRLSIHTHDVELRKKVEDITDKYLALALKYSELADKYLALLEKTIIGDIRND